MKRLALIAIVAGICLAQPVLEKPVPIGEADHWQFKSEGKLVSMAYYRHFTFRDGSRTQLKSRVFLTPKEWEEKAKEYWAVIDNVPPEPERCEDCHDKCGRKP